MKQKSRLGSRFLALLLIFTMLCTAILPVSAASAPALSAANATAKVGDTFTVAVSLKNAASVYNGNFTLQYDSSVLEVQSYTYGNIFDGHTKNCNLDYQSTGNQIRFTFSGAYALTGDGTLVTFTFKAKAAGSSDLKFTAYKMYDENGVSLSPTATNGTATVSAVAVASPVLSVANATAKVGDTFTVAVSLKN
ncbi:MAG: cohesin domain-containing protein, partial [Candidatus Fimenecus sp.]